MKKTASGIAILALLSAGNAAFAADLAVKAPPRLAEPALAPFTWNGLYTGFHAGYGWARRTTSDFDGGSFVLTEPSGFFYGSTIGYNWQIGRIVLGAEADFSHGRLHDSTTFLQDGDESIGGTARIDWFGTVRGRLGLAYDRFLVYATGGFAWAHVNSTFDINFDGARIRFYDDQVHTGWVVGGGVEYAFAPTWSVKAEYLYADLGSKNYAHFSPLAAVPISMTMQTVKLGLNRQFPVDQLPHRALMRGHAEAVGPYRWQGFYLGGHVGYGWAERAIDAPGGDTLPMPKPHGAFYGSNIGYNWQSGMLVLGAEADFSFGRLEDSVTWESGGGGSIGGTAWMDYFGTVRGRVGFAHGHLLAYATGGFAWGQVHSTLDITFDPVALRIYDSQTHTGWTVGGGVEYAFAPRWTVKAEYLYLDLGSRNYAHFSPELPVPISMTAHTGRLGLNYQFGSLLR